MGQFAAKIFFTDNTEMTVVLEKEELASFIKALKNNDPFWAHDKESAFWATQLNVKYLYIGKYQEAKKESDGEEQKSSEEPSS